MSAQCFVNGHDELMARLSHAGRSHDIQAVAIRPGGGYVIVTDNTSRHGLISSGIPAECLQVLKDYRQRGHRIMCVAFPPKRDDAWSVITDKAFFNRNIARATGTSECHDRMIAFFEAGDRPRWLAFPPRGGNSWSIITERRFFNRNIAPATGSSECHDTMTSFLNRGDNPLIVAFPGNGGNSWTLVTRERMFNRNAPIGFHKRANDLRDDLNRTTHLIAFGSKRKEWALVSNGHPAWERFQSSLHGFKFKNRNVPSTIWGNDSLFGDMSLQPTIRQNMSVCGGMAQAAKEHYLYRAQLPADESKMTDGSDPRFQYLFRRQIATLGGISPNPAYSLRWAWYFHQWWKEKDSQLSHWTWREFGLLRDRLIAGELVLLGLIYEDADELWDNHQVLAIGYSQQNDTSSGSITVYEPNDPDNLNVIEFSVEFSVSSVVGGSGRDREHIAMRVILQKSYGRHSRPDRKIRGFFIMEPENKSVPILASNLRMNRIPLQPPPMH